MRDEPILRVRNLRISFKTNTGTVKAVRGINFTLYKGRTLAIVGESGSGKSVTSKAILGILANNKIIEDGEIIYDGKDLLTLPENKFTKVRGVKISMIFQDPLSALNPIMRVGKQLTEAMYLEHKAVKKAAKKVIKTLNKGLTPFKQSFVQDIKTYGKDHAISFDYLKNEHLDAFQSMINEESAKFVQVLQKNLEVVRDYRDACFPENEDKDIENIKAGLPTVANALKECTTILETEPDDIIDVFALRMKHYIKGYLESSKLTTHQNELLTRFNVEEIYDVPAKYRIKEREVIISCARYIQLMEAAIKKLIERIETLIDFYHNISNEYIDSVIKLYADKYVDSISELSASETKARAIEIMKEVGIPEPERRFYQYPFEFSGGMRQRIVIAIALSGNPEVLICDEPTTALDVTIQAQILELINRLKVEKNLSIIFITHDLGVVANMADDIAVMYAGKIVEQGTVYDIFYDPRHPYTWALLGSMPDLDTQGRLDAIPGTPPNMLLPPKGDAFAARNSYAINLDYKQDPPFFPISPTHFAKTWLIHKDAPDVEAPQTVVNRIRNSLNANPNNIPTYEVGKNSILEKILGGKTDGKENN